MFGEDDSSIVYCCPILCLISCLLFIDFSVVCAMNTFCTLLAPSFQYYESSLKVPKYLCLSTPARDQHEAHLEAGVGTGFGGCI